MPFERYAAAGFTSELLPILPPDAEIHPDSPGRENLLVSRGKVPGKRRPGGWFGFGKWPLNITQYEDLATWDEWGSSVGLQGRKYPGLDIDVDDGELADAIEISALFDLGVAPCRFGRGARRLLVFSGPGLKKRRLAFRLPRAADRPAPRYVGLPDGPPYRRQDDLLAEGRAEDGGVSPPASGDERTVHAVELLAEGQQYLLDGVHPKTGKPYCWRDDVRPVAADLVTVTPEQIDAWFVSLEAMLVAKGCEIVERSAGASGSGEAVWQGGLAAPSLEAVARALAAIPNDASYDQWVAMMPAVKASTGGSEEGFALFDDWSSSFHDYNPETTRQKWDSVRPPYRRGWPQLAQLAQERSDGAFSSADEDFEPVEFSDDQPRLSDSQGNMRGRYAWVESAKRAVDLATGDLLDQEQFEFRIPPDEKGRSAWKVFKDQPSGRQDYKHLTCRFGGPLEVVEDMPDLQGRCLNIWRPPARKRSLPADATDQDVALYLQLGESVVPNEAERRHVYDFMAFTAQRQDQKIHHALVLGSRVEGIGKDTLLEPLRSAIGRRYVKEIGPQHLSSAFNPFAVGAKLVIVQEMHNFERKETMNRLKPYVAAPPDAIAVNLKNRQEFFVPNLMSMVFCTNEDDALALSKGDRRYFVTWNDNEPQPREFYERLWDWLAAGGREKVIRWLLNRDLSKFDAKGRAPMTEAKATMRKAARTPLQEFVEDGIDEGDGLWTRDLVLAEEILAIVPDYAKFKGNPVSGQKLAKALSLAGSRPVTERVRIEGHEQGRRIWALRRVATYAALDPLAVRDLYVKQRGEANAAGVHSAEEVFK